MTYVHLPLSFQLVCNNNTIRHRLWNTYCNKYRPVPLRQQAVWIRHPKYIHDATPRSRMGAVSSCTLQPALKGDRKIQRNSLCPICNPHVTSCRFVMSPKGRQHLFLHQDLESDKSENTKAKAMDAEAVSKEKEQAAVWIPEGLPTIIVFPPDYEASPFIV